MTGNISQIVRAQRLAEQMHDHQTDKAGIPYVEHCRRVAAKLSDETAQIVAWLHDLLEDTKMKEDWLREQFSARVVDAVVAMTRKSGEDTTIYYRRVRSNPLALEVKLADIHDNLDPLRMGMLDEATRAKLVLKYGKALQVLFEDPGDV
ncbi:MAG: bifunctional (p)ppGpp synthetase/guanosine-3',5'-bis(diphosphate) 3'-pyrophosphohydrolase [Deltaproteobacteria bacterium]|nr:bifunctional (p)ppGpp synthetase/guanosine-3',5'-bis(diphosphate) 3'-pyrophosphohydrolase [Deltaproteobacteria bacterium]